MPSYRINATRVGGLTRVFNFDCATRAEAERAVRDLGWEPEPDTASRFRPGGSPTAASGAMGGSIDRTDLLLYGGILGLIGGAWLPMISIGMPGMSMNLDFWTCSGWWASASVICAVVAGVFALTGQWTRIPTAAGAALAILTLRFILLIGGISDAENMMAGMGSGASRDPADPFASAMVAALKPSISYGFGWIVLFASAIALMVGGWQARYR